MILGECRRFLLPPRRNIVVDVGSKWVFSTAGALVVQQSRGFRAQKILKILSFQADFCFDKVSAGLLETNDIDEANMENKFSSLPYTGKWITISIK